REHERNSSHWPNQIAPLAGALRHERRLGCQAGHRCQAYRASSHYSPPIEPAVPEGTADKAHTGAHIGPRIPTSHGLEIEWPRRPPPPAAAFALARSRQLRITTATTRSGWRLNGRPARTTGGTAGQCPAPSVSALSGPLGLSVH